MKQERPNKDGQTEGATRIVPEALTRGIDVVLNISLLTALLIHSAYRSGLFFANPLSDKLQGKHTFLWFLGTFVVLACVETVPPPPLEIKAVCLNSLRRSCGKRSACFCSSLGPPNAGGTIGLPNGWNVNSFPASKVLISLSESDQCGDRGLNLIVAGVPGAVW